MSRSHRKHPFIGFAAAATEKQDKRLANRAFRRLSNIAIAQGKEPPQTIKATSNVWTFDKDGKQYLDAPHRNYKLMGK